MSMLHLLTALMPKPLPTKEFQATTFDGTALTTYTFASQNIGIASSTRRVIVAVRILSSAARTISSVTVGGVAATAVVTRTVTNFFNYRLSFYIADVPTGTTADVVITNSGACEASSISVWAAYNLASSIAVDSDLSTNTSSPFAIPSLSTTEGGILVAASLSLTGGAVSASWTNATERSDVSSSYAGAFVGSSAADAGTTGAGVAVSVAVAGTGFDAGLAVAASFR